MIVVVVVVIMIIIILFFIFAHVACITKIITLVLLTYYKCLLRHVIVQTSSTRVLYVYISYSNLVPYYVQHSPLTSVSHFVDAHPIHILFRGNPLPNLWSGFPSGKSSVCSDDLGPGERRRRARWRSVL